MPEDRRLAAIMFTDIVGYTALMGRDEDKAFQILRKNRNIQRPIIKKYRGEWLKEMGDGILASFTTASDAVRCAGEIQAATKKAGIGLRIGIHEGEVVFEGGDVLGDGVNVASRLEEMAEEGCINISGAVYKDIKNKVGIQAEFIEEKMLKNVDEPVKVYKVCCEEIEDIKVKEESPTQPTKPSIAVLPFVNMSADPEQEYFCDGITEEIINALSHVGSIKVIARTSAFMFKGKYKDIREIGKKLDVETLLEGSVRKAGNQLRITAQLIAVSDGSHIWSDAYNRKLEDVFAIQEEISMAIVDNMRVKLLGKEKVAIVKRHTENLEAYNLYLKGNYYWQMLTAEGFSKAIKCFEQSLQKDPKYALAYIGMATVYWASSYWGNVSPNDAYPQAKKYVNKALEIDNTLAEAYSLLGAINMNYYWNWKAAERELKQALQLSPNSAFIHISYSMLLTFTEYNEEAIAEAKRAQELDPLSSWINTVSGNVYDFANQHDKAIEEYRMVISINPNYFLAHYHLGINYAAKSMIKEAVEEYKKAIDLSDGNPLVMASLAALYYNMGKQDETEKLYIILMKRTKTEYVLPLSFYLIHKARGDHDQVFEWFEQMCNEHDSFLPWMLVFPHERYRIPDQPRFNELLEKVGLKRKGN
jgi:TolB-like protein/Tfp pilus assembly protein PilF